MPNRARRRDRRAARESAWPEPSAAAPASPVAGGVRFPGCRSSSSSPSSAARPRRTRRAGSTTGSATHAGRRWWRPCRASPRRRVPTPPGRRAAGAVAARRPRAARTPCPAARPLHDPHLADLRAVVAPADRPTRPRRRRAALSTPASTLKLLTATAALETLGPRPHASRPRVVADRATRHRPGRRRRPVPRTASSRPTVPATARRQPRRRWPACTARAAAGPRESPGSGSPTTPRCSPGPRVNPHWPKSYVPDGVVSPDHRALGRRGRWTPTAPAGSPTRRATAAELFAAYLRSAASRSAGGLAERHRARDARELARVHQPARRRHRRAGAAGQRQRGRRGARPPGRAGGRRARARSPAACAA